MLLMTPPKKTSKKKVASFAAKDNYVYMKLNVHPGFSGKRGTGNSSPPPKSALESPQEKEEHKLVI